MTQSSGRSENFTIRALYLIAIVLVVDGHTPFRDMLDLGGLFGYYSFHLMLFAFGSGYLLAEGEEAHPLAFIARFAAFSIPPQQGTSIRTTVTLLMSFFAMISVSLSA